MTRPLLLVVDDDARSRELLGVILHHAGFDVAAAADARAAVELLATHEPVLALVDGLMPGMSGIEFCR
jgi:CheY-like chemotaxis protein